MWLCGGLLVLLALGAYANSFRGLLVFDDQEAIGSNRSIRSLWPLTQAMAAPEDTPLAGRPVSNLTFAINYALAPADARDSFLAPPTAPLDVTSAVTRNLWGYHAVNLAIHALAGLVLFGLVRRALLTPRLRDDFAPRATLLALLAAALWLAHPLQTASVTYLAQRVEALAGLFYLLTLYCALRAWRAPQSVSKPEGRGGPNWWTAAAIAACAFGMGSKEIVVTAPIAVVLFDLVFLAPTPPDSTTVVLLRRRWPLYAGLAATWAILGAILIGNPRPHSAGLLEGWSPWNYLLTQTAVIVHYLRLAVVPTGLTLDYAWPRAQSLIVVLPQAVLIAALLLVTVYAVIRRHPAGFCLAWFFLVLAPTSSIYPIVTEVAADHRMYLPLAGIVLLAVVGGDALVTRLGNRLPRPGFRLRPVAIVACCAAIATLVILTRARNESYRSVEGIWADTLAKRPGSAVAEHNYGVALLTSERFAEAEPHLRRSVAIDGKRPEVRASLGVALCAQHKFDEGTRELLEAVRLSPGYADAHRNLAEAYAAQGLFAKALEQYRTVLEHAPDDVGLLNTAGWILATSQDDRVRDGRGALDLAQRAVQLTGGDDPTSLDTLAAAYAELGRYREAESAATRAEGAARAKGEAALAREIEERVALYRTNQKFRER